MHFVSIYLYERRGNRGTMHVIARFFFLKSALLNELYVLHVTYMWYTLLCLEHGRPSLTLSFQWYVYCIYIFFGLSLSSNWVILHFLLKYIYFKFQ